MRNDADHFLIIFVELEKPAAASGLEGVVLSSLQAFVRADYLENGLPILVRLALLRGCVAQLHTAQNQEIEIGRSLKPST